ncbi:helix-turn-helix domain-containing protein [Azovibrio restrictus]|uniref:helix-turn-helix domain-containing protein n=1 Tax=Azovibrio restrictus TaxID=146938 RepID=UPI0026EED416|nr:helix-turn-helix domain-containing protein [Azovibrio restrictus]MDD3481826.1 helix-turn-helix domain containing protein [Azovibrio restrictus]
MKEKSRTQQALDLVAEGMTAYAAAEKVGITEQAVYAAKRRLEKARQAGKTLCPCCGQVVREGFEINRDMLKDGGKR